MEGFQIRANVSKSLIYYTTVPLVQSFGVLVIFIFFQQCVCTPATCHPWSFCRSTTRASGRRSRPAASSSPNAATWARRSWPANTETRPRSAPSDVNLFSIATNLCSLFGCCRQKIQEKMTQLEDKRQKMMFKWDDRWDWLRLCERKKSNRIDQIFQSVFVSYEASAKSNQK